MADQIAVNVAVKNQTPTPSTYYYQRIPVQGDFIEVTVERQVVLCVVKQVILHQNPLIPVTVYAETLEQHM